MHFGVDNSLFSADYVINWCGWGNISVDTFPIGADGATFGADTFFQISADTMLFSVDDPLFRVDEATFGALTFLIRADEETFGALTSLIRADEAIFRADTTTSLLCKNTFPFSRKCSLPSY